MLLVGLACATSPAKTTRSFDFFVEPDPDRDFWFGKVAEWQGRSRNGPEARPIERVVLAGTPQLGDEVETFRRAQRRSLARNINGWAQIQAMNYYRHDPDPDSHASDHWPTYAELLAYNGDDCDGVDLIAYHMMREFGFGPDELYRAIVRRTTDGANHMVTLWFEDPQDPWVLDGTRAMTREMLKMSELTGWTPTHLFNETRQFRVVERPSGRASLAAE